MGRLQNQRTGVTFELLTETLIGRAPGSDLMLDASGVSKGHALIRWSGTVFLVRDKGSTNGTWLNHKRLLEGQDQPLALGDLLEFGGQDQPWLCSDVTAPVGAPALLTDRLRHSLSDSLLRVGAPNTVLLIVGGQPYKLALSPGEYDVVRALAEQRLADRAEELPREGWAIRRDFGDRVCGSVYTLNQHVKRLRDKVRDLDVLSEDATQIVEQGDGEIRIGVARVSID